MSQTSKRGVHTDRDFKSGPGGLSSNDFAKWYQNQSISQWKNLDLKAIVDLADVIENVQNEGHTVYIMGNGGSAATASHIATDLSKTAARSDRPRLKCISLSDNVSYLTAIGNDMGYEYIFVRQMENLLNKNDVVILVSGSGNSPNILRAAEYAKKLKALTVGLIGFDGGKLKSMVDITLHVPCHQYGVVEDLHMSVGHIVTFYLKQKK